MKKKSIYFITIVKRLAPACKEVKNSIKGEKTKKSEAQSDLLVERDVLRWEFLKSEKSGGGQITEKTESQCKVSGGDTVGGLIGKTQYVNSWRDASYTTCKLDGTN